MLLKVPVAIIGAGPTGLTAAICLLERGIDCIVIDKNASPIKTSNALAVQARTLEIWDSLGVAQTAIAQGLCINRLNIYSDISKIGTISFQKIDSPYPFALGLPQATTEHILLEKLLSLGGMIHRNTTLVSVEQNHEAALLVMQSENQEKTQIKANWVLGCDGTHSIIRESMKIPFVGKNLPQHFIMADLPLINQLANDEINVFLSSQGVMAVIPLKSFCRILFDVTHVPSLAHVKVPDFEIFKELAKARSFIPLDLKQPSWTSGFWIHEHVVTHCRHDRIFLLGDAAHEHSPVGGQGMNTGIQDAYNLCWKLAMVEKKHIKTIFLNSFEGERLPIAKKVVKNTTLATKVLTAKNPIAKKLLWTLIKYITHVSYIKQQIATSVANLKVNYAHSEYCKEKGLWKNGIKPGWRIPYRLVQVNGANVYLQNIMPKDKFTLLVFSADKENNNETAAFINAVKDQYSILMECYLVKINAGDIPLIKSIEDPHGDFHTLFGIKAVGFYLIRPDQYVAFRSPHLDINPLRDYFTDGY